MVHSLLEGATAYVGFDIQKESIPNYFLCDGTADEAQINLAITYVGTLGGGGVLLEEGDYDIQNPVLIQNKTDIKIIHLYYSGLPNESHFKFGELLNRELIYSKEQTAVIASGDLSHSLTKDSPGGYCPKGKKFDNKIIELLQRHDTE